MEHTSTNSLSSLLELFKVDIHSDMPNGKKINKQTKKPYCYVQFDVYSKFAHNKHVFSILSGAS